MNTKDKETSEVWHTTPVPINNVECWNFNRTTHVIPAGTELSLNGVGDAHRMICRVRANNESGMLCEVDGRLVRGYRFFVPNATLNELFGLNLPTRNVDFVELLIKYENGDATAEETTQLFSNPACRGLQGHYSSRCTAP